MVAWLNARISASVTTSIRDEWKSLVAPGGLGSASGRRSFTGCPNLTLLEPGPLFVAADGKPGTWVGVFASGPPAAVTSRCLAQAHECFSRGFRRCPHPAPLKPLQRDIRLGSLELLERWQQIVGRTRTKGRGVRPGHDDPIGEVPVHIQRVWSRLS